jgi:hypothetical protein
MRPNDHDLLCGAMKQPSTHMDTIGYHWHEQKKRHVFGRQQDKAALCNHVSTDV